MRIIAVMNQKGGVGKTTTTVNLGAALAELGRRVCLVDLDPQAHLTINYGVEPSSEDVPSLFDVLVEEMPFIEAMRQVDERITLVPSSIDLAAAEVELVAVLGRETILKKRIDAARQFENAIPFDVMLLDCPPSLGLLTLNALAVADEVIVPMQPQFLPLQGMAKLLETVQLVNRRMNPELKVSGVVLTMFDSQTKLSNEVVAELSGFIEAAKGQPLPWAEAKLFKTKIRRNIKLAESPSFGQNILKYDPASNGATDYRNLAREVIAMREPPAAAEPAPAETGTSDAAPVLEMNPEIEPAKLAAAKAGLQTAKAEIAAARAKIAAAKRRPSRAAKAPARAAAAKPAAAAADAAATNAAPEDEATGEPQADVSPVAASHVDGPDEAVA
jgi:chromosome partitioning protein